MRTYRMRVLATIAVAAATVASESAVRADVASDRAAAILIFPRILYTNATQETETPFQFRHEGVDTVIQLTNTTNDPVTLQCFYVSANAICSISGVVCDTEHLGVPCPLPQDVCLPRWMETDFRIDITAQQPLVWKVSEGLAQEKLPLDGVVQRGPTGQNNAGTAIPPVPVDSRPDAGPDITFAIFSGELKCVVVDGTGRALPRNAIKGEATLVSDLSYANMSGQQQIPVVEKYNGIGIQAIDGDSNDDGILELGGGANEYNGCPNVLIVDHFFDNYFGTKTALKTAADLTPPDPSALQQTAPLGVISELTLVPCSQNLREQIPGHTVAQFLVFNEFEQRFSTSATVDCLFRHFLSVIDTSDPSRSIFSAGVAGTTVGQTRIRGVSGGLLGVLSEFNSSQIALLSFVGLDNAANLHFQGDRENPDFIVLP